MFFVYSKVVKEPPQPPPPPAATLKRDSTFIEKDKSPIAQVKPQIQSVKNVPKLGPKYSMTLSHIDLN